MAQVTTVRLVDDLDGTEADESISFALDGVALEIDLSNDNAENLRGIMEAYTNRGAGDGTAEKPGLPRVTDPFIVSFT